MNDLIAWVSLGISSGLMLFTVWSEYQAAKRKAAAERLGVSDEIAQGAQTLIKITRDELERERLKRIELEKEVKGLKVELEKLRIELTNAINCSLLLYGQIVSSGMKPIVEPKRINDDPPSG